MRILDEQTKRDVERAISDNRERLELISGFVDAAPGFPIVNGQIVREPAIIVYVAHKKPESYLDPTEKAPRQFGAYRVSVMQADPDLQLNKKAEFEPLATALAEASTSSLTYEKLPDNPIDHVFEIDQPFVCHVGPDAGWPTLKPFLEATEKTLSVAMYDFNAEYIARTFIDTVKSRGIKTILTWDNSMRPEETAIRGKLKVAIKEQLDGWVVKCGANHRFATAYHEKVAVRDSKAFWLSSGNWSLRSQPEIDPIADPKSAKGMYSRGNREWHVIVENEGLSQLFERYITYDRDESEREAEGGDATALGERETFSMPDLFVSVEDMIGGLELAAAIAEPVAPSILPSSPRSVRVQPVLTPDNYLERVTELLSSAQRSLYLQFAYIHYSATARDKRFTDLLLMLADLSYRPGLDMRIILGRDGAANWIRKLAENGFNDKVFRVQGSIHNKGIIVDGAIVLVSSTNWSSDGVLRNRDAGLIIHDAEVAQYYQSVFIDDWNERARAYLADDPAVLIAAPGDEPPPGMVRTTWRDYYG
ncbi:phospholipase D-like domain-containing protein (plasmid) [Agrobacterium leguminum]|uniref:phospholipase D-like domain-containing protein n=1 Tax=Agrobacterium leguminum TaxID=2792015 RepID=UPI002729C463|nr:phospholipase D-like domain-containing protein [Agrobacterium leguminum]WLE01024.1 phospholipase D-like domain-containing protein [Agrobacterium leguminum]